METRLLLSLFFRVFWDRFVIPLAQIHCPELVTLQIPALCRPCSRTLFRDSMHKQQCTRICEISELCPPSPSQEQWPIVGHRPSGRQTQPKNNGVTVHNWTIHWGIVWCWCNCADLLGNPQGEIRGGPRQGSGLFRPSRTITFFGKYYVRRCRS